MKYYVVVEGERTEKTLYKYWINYINQNLTFSENLDKLNDNEYYIFAGYGYPNYFEVIEAAIMDSALYNIDRIVIAVDSENQTFIEKKEEIAAYICKYNCKAEIKIIIQHFCIETWGLANRRINSRNIQNSELKKYKLHFDIYDNDPELLMPIDGDAFNRAQFAMRYLNLLLKEKNPKIIYSKSNPKSLIPEHYFKQIVKRYNETEHIKSFKTFIDAFS